METEGYTALILFQAMSEYAFSSELPEDEELRKQAAAFAGLNEDASEAELHEKLAVQYNLYVAAAEKCMLKIRENIWRLPAWQPVDTRRKFPLYDAVIAVLACPAALPEELHTSLFALIDIDENAMKLIRGNADVKAKFDEFDRLWEAYSNEPDCPADLGAEQLLRHIPEIALPSYSKNAYEAAIQALQAKYADEIKQANEECKKLEEKGATETENVQYITDNLPTFRQLAADKIHVWKEVNLTPTVAKVKLLLGQKMSDAEATRLVEEVQAVKHGSKALFGKKYREDVAQRVYTDRVKSRLEKKAERLQEKSGPSKSASLRRETPSGSGRREAPTDSRRAEETTTAKYQVERQPEQDKLPTPTSRIGLGVLVAAGLAFLAGTAFIGLPAGIAAALIILLFCSRVQTNQ